MPIVQPSWKSSGKKIPAGATRPSGSGSGPSSSGLPSHTWSSSTWPGSRTVSSASIGTPRSSASTRTKALATEPIWNPSLPP